MNESVIYNEIIKLIEDESKTKKQTVEDIRALVTSNTYSNKIKLDKIKDVLNLVIEELHPLLSSLNGDSLCQKSVEELLDEGYTWNSATFMGNKYDARSQRTAEGYVEKLSEKILEVLK